MALVRRSRDHRHHIALSETGRELQLVAERHGCDLRGIDIIEQVPFDAVLDPHRELTVLHPANIELSETIKLVFERVEQLNPTRVVFDGLSKLLLLAQNPLRYRQVLSLKDDEEVAAWRRECLAS